MRALVPVAATLLLAVAAPAWAQPAGEIVRDVRFEGVGEEEGRLRDLLKVQLGAPLSPATVRETMDLYYQKGRYASIAVETTPVEGGVALTFRFRQQALLTDWRFEGNAHLSGEVLARALDLSWGAPILPREFSRYARLIHERYQREGFLHARAAFTLEPGPENGQRLIVKVDEGAPLTLSAIRVLDPGPLSEQAIRRAIDLRPGGRIQRDTFLRGLTEIERQLAEGGYLNNRIASYFVLPDGRRVSNFTALVEAAPMNAELVVAVDAGVKGVVKVEGDVLLRENKLARAITVYQNRSYSPYELDASAEALRKLYVSEGYPEAKVTHRLEPMADESYVITFTVAAGPRVQVEAVNFVGNTALPDETLAGVLATRKAGFLGEGGVFDPAVWEEDMLRLVNYYRTQGYLSAKVVGVDRVLAPEDNKLTLTVRVDEGPRTRVSSLLFEGVTAFHEAGILQALGVNPGEPYNPYRLGEYISSVEAYYARSGYPLARVSGALVSDATPETSALKFTVDPGPRKKLGDVIFRGDIKTQDIVVRRQLTVRQGQWYNSEELLRTQQQIYQLGFFERVNIGPLRPITDNPADPVDLVVELRERETGWMGIGGGYGSLQGPQVGLEYQQTNLGGTGRPLRLETTLSRNLQEAEASFRDPYFLGRRLIGQAGFLARHDETLVGRQLITYGPNIGISREISDSMLLSLRYAWGRTNYLAWREQDRLAAGGLRAYTNSVLTGGFTYDTRSDILNPRWGTKTDFTLDLATPTFGGDLLYTRPSVTWAYYYPVTRRVVLALGAEAGYIQTLGNTTALPTDLRFVTGGANSLRGYATRKVGLGNTEEPGRGLLLGHVEVRFPIWGDLGGAAFVDAGNIFAQPQDLNPLDMRVTAGPGLRYLTPVGPIRLDLAFRIRPTVGFGDVHFGIGQAF